MRLPRKTDADTSTFAVRSVVVHARAAAVDRVAFEVNPLVASPSWGAEVWKAAVGIDDHPAHPAGCVPTGPLLKV
jgi:hypothetical protein